MDTVYSLVGKIGRNNLSRQANKRMQELKDLNENYALLDKALKETKDETEKAQIQKEHTKAGAYIEKFENSLLQFLNDEYEDVLDKKEKAEAKAEEEARIKEAEEAEAATKEQEEAEKAKAEAEAQSREEEIVRAEAEAQANAGTDPNAESKTKEKKPSIAGGLIIGGLLALLGLGAYMANRNK